MNYSVTWNVMEFQDGSTNDGSSKTVSISSMCGHISSGGEMVYTVC